jgi:predicted DNA-binding ribbon-helix-helix protein
VTAKPQKAVGGDAERRSIERVQTGVRIEKRLLQVLKALAESHDLSLGDLLEGIVLHAFEGAAPFGAESLARIAALKQVYRLDLDAKDSHLLIERGRKKRT